MSKTIQEKINTFCTIQLEILKEKEASLRRDLLDCKIQREFLEGMIYNLTREENEPEKH